MRLVCAVLALAACTAFAAAPATEPSPVESTGLRSIAGWLKRAGVEGYLGADVADAMGIARGGEEVIAARQRGFRNDVVVRVAQVLGHDTLLFMVQGPSEVRLYLSTVNGGLRKAIVSSRGLITPLETREAQASFREEVLYWEDKVAREAPL